MIPREYLEHVGQEEERRPRDQSKRQTEFHQVQTTRAFVHFEQCEGFKKFLVQESLCGQIIPTTQP